MPEITSPRTRGAIGRAFRQLGSAALLIACAASACAEGAGIHGAGSTAAALIYQGWARDYQVLSGVALNYEAVGSGAGIQRIRARELDFGATDVAPSEAELARDGLILIPIAITGIAPVFNLPKFNDQALRLSGDVLAQIFLGQIKRWNASEIADLNPGARLPDAPITVVVRADGSGTSYHFGDYLGKVNPNWQSKMSAKTSYVWPSDFVAVKGSTAVVKAVRDTPGSIGYVDFGYVKESHLAVVQMRNADGEYPKPSAAAFRAALMNSDWVRVGAFSSTLTDKHGKDTWPLTMGTYALIPGVVDNAVQSAKTLNYFTWALLKGDSVVQENNFVRLPDRVQAAAFRALVSVRDKTGKAVPVSMN